MARATQLTDLESLIQENPTINYIPPSSPDYTNARMVYNASRTDNPLAIVQPQSHSKVCALIMYAKRKSLPFTLRSGGHNLEGRAVVENALLIDLRALTGVTIATDRKSATIQGGTLQGEVGNTLWNAGLGTPIGLIPSVGYVGWAVYGGYGPFSAHWGLGVDQIIGATVVNPDGEVIHADDALLEGIRGAGGLYGVILELVVKVYSISKVGPGYPDLILSNWEPNTKVLKLLAGPIIFDPTDIQKTFVQYNAEYRKLEAEDIPAELTLQQTIFNGPRGRAFAIRFVWSGDDLEEGQYWSRKIAALGPVMVNAIVPTTIPEILANTGAHVPPRVYGSALTHNVSLISSETAEAIGRGIAKLPNNPGTMMSIHQLRGKSTKSQVASVFEARDPHFMLEILGFSNEASMQFEAEAWAAGVAEDVLRASPGNVLPTGYISLYNSHFQANSSEEYLEKTYGSRIEVLKILKSRFDPENVFGLTVPTLNTLK